MTASPLPLEGVRIVEISSFVAAPLCGMTLAQLGAEVIRVDPLGGAADRARWPVTADGESIYWAGLNKGKRSITADLRSAEGRELVRRLIVESGPTGAVVLTNAAWGPELGYEALAAERSETIHVQITGRADGGTGVDYTVNAATGIPLITGPADHRGPVNHALPAWDIACGLYAALSLTAAVHRREKTGSGAQITIPLEDVALATVGNLGYLAEVQINGVGRERLGNDIFGQYGHDFVTSDGDWFMVVTLTPRHFRDLTALTGTADAIAALGTALGVDFADEGVRYRHRSTLNGLFAAWFREHTGDEVAAGLADCSTLSQRYLTLPELVEDPRVQQNPLFARLDQPRIGPHLTPALPAIFDGAHLRSGAAPALGEDTAEVLRERLGLTDAAPSTD